MLGFGIFALSTFWFVFVLAIAVIWMFAFVENVRPGMATLDAIIVLWFLHASGRVNLFTIAHDPRKLLLYVGLYILIGLVWTVIKWHFHLTRWQDSSLAVIGQFKKQWFNNGNPNEVGPEQRQMDYEKALASALANSGIGRIPQADNEKGKLIFWGLYWPFSAIWTLINDPLRKAWEYLVFTIFGNFLQGMAERKAARVEAAKRL